MSEKKNYTRSVVIVGATGGLGSAFVEHYCKDNNTFVFACSRRAPEMAEPTDSNVENIYLDLRNEESIRNAAERCSARGPLHTVIVATGFLHNQDFQPEKRIADIDPAAMLYSYEVNTLGPVLIAKYFLPCMDKKTETYFACLSARVSSISDNRLGGWHAYRSSKAALNMLLKNLSIETRFGLPRCIILGLHPGTVDTSLSRPFQKNVPQKQLFSPEQSVHALLRVIEKSSVTDSGSLFAWDGEEITF